MGKLNNQGLLYDDLTETQKQFFKKYLYNGVGSREYAINPHDLIFKTPALYHDYSYFKGGNDKLRKLADKDFLERSLIEVKKQKFYIRPFYYIVAYMYYAGLKLFSKKAWEYYEIPAKDWKEFIDRVIVSFDSDESDYPWKDDITDPFSV